MKALERLADRVRTGQPIPWPIAGLLSAATPIVRVGMWKRLREPAIEAEAEVISFGNITAGGTGKTPCVIERARAELATGKKVGILTRGYHSRDGRPAVSADVPATERYAVLGDEAALILQALPHVLVFKNADRVAAARMAISRYGCDVLLLDDGYQYVRLARDENVLVIDSANPFGDGHLVPRGILREPLEAMVRATSVVLTRCDQGEGIDALEATIRRYCPEAPIRRTIHRPVFLRRLDDGEALSVEWLRGRSVAAACSIGNPESFSNTLESLGATVTSLTRHPDHAPLPASALQGDVPVIVTEKDAIRMGAPPENVYALGIELADA